MTDVQAPFHAHVYFDAATEAAARALREELRAGTLPGVLMVGPLVGRPIGPHPLPQFEFHFMAPSVPAVRARLQASGLLALIHPVTDDDLADHTRLAEWLGGPPLTLDLSVLDPIGKNQGIARFGRDAF